MKKYRRSIAAIIMATSLLCGTMMPNLSASAKQFTCNSSGYAKGVKTDFNNRNKPAYVRLTFTSLKQTTYIRYYNKWNQPVWTGTWNGAACLQRKMYLGPNVYRISAKTNRGTNRIQVDPAGNCKVK
ncbi:MAG: hypothetical protein II916_05700 [Oscillospiraceae bacterium]|nr:hypothetical protein [Oscillospiraceae bacterium]